jgi:hypothetical protein
VGNHDSDWLICIAHAVVLQEVHPKRERICSRPGPAQDVACGRAS